MGPINFYFGLKVTRDRERKTLKLSQLANVYKILTKFYLDKAKTSNTPMKKTLQLPNKSKKITTAEKECY